MEEKEKRLSYTIGEACRMLNITQGGIRFYEKKGIIQSQRQEENQYRQYTFKELNTIATLREYRNLGFSLEEAGLLIKQQNASDLEEQIVKQIEKTQQEIILQQKRLEQLTLKYSKINQIRKELNQFRIAKRPALYRLSCQEGDKLISDKTHKKTMTSWLTHTPDIKYSPCIPLHKLKPGVPVEMGFSILQEQIDFQVPESPYMTYYPEQLCIYTIIQVTTNHLSIEGFYRLILPSLGYIEENAYQLCGDILGEKLASLGENEAIDYYEVSFPIVKK